MWLITIGHPLIRQRFFAAVDVLDQHCVTSSPSRALRFALREDAEKHAALYCAAEDWALART